VKTQRHRLDSMCIGFLGSGGEQAIMVAEA
jgi:hypothetical protein